MNQMELPMRPCTLDRSGQNATALSTSIPDNKCQPCWACNAGAAQGPGSPLRVIAQRQIPKNNNPAANPGNYANSNSNAAGTTTRPKRDFRFQVIQVRQGPKWFILPSKHNKDEQDDDNENGNVPRLSPKKNASSDQENQEMLSPTSPCSPISPRIVQDSQLPFAMDSCGNQSCKAVACGSSPPKNAESQAPAMVSVTATKQIADFPSPLSEPTTRRFPPAAAGNRFQVIRNVNIAPALNSSPNASDSKEVILSSSKSSSSSPERESSVMKTENLNAPSNLAVLVDSNEAKGVSHSETNNLSVQSSSSMNSLTYSSTSSGCSTAPSLMGQAMESNANASDPNIFERSFTGSAFEILAKKPLGLVAELAWKGDCRTAAGKVQELADEITKHYNMNVGNMKEKARIALSKIEFLKSEYMSDEHYKPSDSRIVGYVNEMIENSHEILEKMGGLPDPKHAKNVNH
ncbi:hypothetical protein DdX_14518 [Ditylenchus destructor]|uniref:Uncharacterized protein n=1 Tax=Ditylenchus destructor TaxID=166010 RepID=A0AAD4MU19_9BILA|nr:hypothetical protein DdX_14518 [Ditylenchus destructor]